MGLGSLGRLFVEIGADTSELEKGFEGAEKQVKGFGISAQTAGKMVGAGMTAAGAGIMALTQSSMKTNAALGTTALQLGITKAEMRDLALETANVTFPLTEVTASFDLLTRAGMTNKDQMAATASAFDTLGDAIGKPASEVVTALIPAFAAFKIPLEDAALHTDTFTHLMRNTTVELSDFSSMVNYLAADLDTMDISMVESVAVMEALAAKGIQGSAATREFRKAVSAADGDINAFYGALGITASEVAVYSGKINDSTGITEKFAAAQNEQFTTFDKIKHAISEQTLRYGSMLEPLEALGPAMTTLGPIMIMMSSIQWATVIPALAATAAGVWAVIAPALPFIAAALLIIGVLYLLEERFGIVTMAIDFITSAFTTLIDWLSTALGAGIELAKNVIDGLGDKLLFILGPIGAIIYAFKNWDKITEIVTGIFANVLGYLSGLWSSFNSAGAALIQALINGITGAIGGAVEAVKSGLGRIRNLLPFSDAKEGPLSDLTESGKQLIKTFSAGMDSQKSYLSSKMNDIIDLPDLDLNLDKSILSSLEELSKISLDLNFVEPLIQPDISETIVNPLVNQPMIQPEIDMSNINISDSIKYLTELSSEFFDAGAGLFEAFISGMKSILVSDTITNILEMIRSYLPFSDAKKGPLADLTESGRSMMETFAAGMAGAGDILSTTFAANAPQPAAMTAPLEGGATTNANSFSVNIQNVTLSKDYGFNEMLDDIRSRRMRDGIRFI